MNNLERIEALRLCENAIRSVRQDLEASERHEQYKRLGAVETLAGLHLQGKDSQ